MRVDSQGGEEGGSESQVESKTRMETGSLLYVCTNSEDVKEVTTFIIL